MARKKKIDKAKKADHLADNVKEKPMTRREFAEILGDSIYAGTISEKQANRLIDKLPRDFFVRRRPH